MEEKNIDYFLNYVKALFLKKIRTNYGISQRELAIQIERSEISVKKYETGRLNIPFSVLFLTTHILDISKNKAEKLLEEVFEENSEKFTDDFKKECLKKMRLDIAKIFKNEIEEIDEDEEYSDLDDMKLETQIKKYIKKVSKSYKKSKCLDENKVTKEIISFINFKLNENIENGKKINETLIAKELMSYLRFKINDFVENEVDEEFDEILEEE